MLLLREWNSLPDIYRRGPGLPYLGLKRRKQTPQNLVYASHAIKCMAFSFTLVAKQQTTVFITACSILRIKRKIEHSADSLTSRKWESNIGHPLSDFIYLTSRANVGSKSFWMHWELILLLKLVVTSSLAMISPHPFEHSVGRLRHSEAWFCSQR